jgi:hypothetical protein
MMGAFVLVSPAMASDWTITSRLSQTFEANNNYFMVQDPSGSTLRSLSTLYFDSLYRTATSRHVLSGDISYYKYSGPGAEDTELKQGINNGARYQYQGYGKLPKDRDLFNLIWRRQDVASAQLEDQAQVTSKGETNNYIVDGGVVRQLSALDTLTLLGRATANAFENEEQNFTDVFGSARLTHSYNSLTELTANVDFDWFKYNNIQNTETQLWKFMGGFVTRPNSQLTIRANFGYVLANTTADPLPQLPGGGNQPPPPPSPDPNNPLPPLDTNSPPPLQPVQAAGSFLDWIGDIYITYKVKTETYNLFASKFVSPDIFGALQERKRIGASFRHEINRLSGLGLASTYTLTNQGRGPTATQPADWNAIVNYDYAFTRDLRGQLIYNYRVRFPDSQTSVTATTTTVPPPDNSTITSHGFYVVLTANVTLKP